MAVAISGALLVGCGSGGSASQTAIERTCQRVSAVLSDGPDPTADPVGYAEAQILPLRGLGVPDATLRKVIDQLDEGYQQEYSTSGGATKAVADASARLNAICPGAAP